MNVRWSTFSQGIKLLKIYTVDSQLTRTYYEVQDMRIFVLWEKGGVVALKGDCSKPDRRVSDRQFTRSSLWLRYVPVVGTNQALFAHLIGAMPNIMVCYR